ncbi:unnamed protein product [Prunus brigantina]
MEMLPSLSTDCKEVQVIRFNMSSSSSPAQTKRCQYCGAAMVLRVSKSDKNRGKPFWKCLTSYGATSCNGFEWVDVTSAEADQQPDTYDATILNMLKSIKDLVLVLLVLSIVILFVLLMTN